MSGASDPANDDWVKIYALQQRASEEMEKRKVVKRKSAQRTVRAHLDSQMSVTEQRSQTVFLCCGKRNAQHHIL